MVGVQWAKLAHFGTKDQHWGFQMQIVELMDDKAIIRLARRAAGGTLDIGIDLRASHLVH
jgi:hypothetical protein